MKDKETSAETWRVYRRLLTYLWPFRGRFAVSLLAMAVYGATDGGIPWILKRVLDDIFGHQDSSKLYLLVGVIFFFALLRGIFGFIQRYYSATVGNGIVENIRNDISRKLLELSPGFFSAETSGGLLSRMTNDVLLIRSALTDAAAALLRDTIRVAALLVAAILLDPKLALIAFLGFPMAMLPIIKFGRRIRRLGRTGQDKVGGLTSILHEIILGNRIVQSFTMEEREQERFEAENRALTKTLNKAEKYGALSGPTNEAVAALAIALVILYGGFSVISGVRTQGDFIAFITSMLLLYEPLKKLGRVNNIVYSGVAAAERIFELLDLTPEIQSPPDAPPLKIASPRIEYRSVDFRYDAGKAERTVVNVDDGESVSRDWVLEDVSFTVEPGSTFALVGSSGGGKSTIVNLLPRFYDVIDGEILISGRNIREVDLRSLRKAIAVVSQQTFLFNDTVFNNIRYGKPEASDEEVYAAAAAAHADIFISAMPAGYDTLVGEQGFRLSGGERARLAIARALLKDAPILILDEATASLDSES